MKILTLGAVSLSMLLAGCGTTTPDNGGYLATPPELRTNFIDIATNNYVACDITFGTTAPYQNIAVVEFAAPEAQSAQIDMIGETTGSSDPFVITELRDSSRGNFIADLVSNRLLPADVRALEVRPQYQYVSLTDKPRGSFTTRVTLQTPNGPVSAVTGSVKIYKSCQYLTNAESRD